MKILKKLLVATFISILLPVMALAQVTVPAGGTGSTGYAKNVLLYFNGTRIVATSSQPLYVGNLFATTTTATSTFLGSVHIGSSALRTNLLQIDCLINYPASQSVGGCVNINNTLNSGPAQNIFSSFGAGATAPLFKVREDNSAYDQEMVTLQSQSLTRSTLGVEGSSTAQAVIKGAHYGNGADGNVAVFSGDMAGSGTAAQGLFLTSTQGGTLGHLVQLKNNLLAFGGADAQVNIFDITGNGLVGISSSTPFGTLSINAASQTNPYFVIGSSSATVLSVSPFLSGSNLLTVSTTTGDAMVISGSGFSTTTVSGLSVSGSATSTSNVGWNITSGCFAINNTCVSGSGSTFTGAANSIVTTNSLGALMATGSQLTTGTINATTTSGIGTSTFQTLAVTPTTSVGSSVTTGGAFKVDNTLNNGAGAVFYTNHGSGATSRLGVFNCPGTGFDQDCVVMQSLGNSNITTLNIQASSTGKGGLKVEEKGMYNPNASGASIDVQGNIAQDLFLNSTGRSTGNYITGHNPTGGTNVFEFQSYDGGGRFGIASDTPTFTVSIGELNTGTFGISTTTNGCSQFTNGQLWITGSSCNTGSSAPNLVYQTIGSTAFYTASSTLTDNKTWYFGNGFIANASSTVAALFRTVGIGLGKAPSVSVRAECLNDSTYTTCFRAEGDTIGRFALSSFVTSDAQVRFAIQVGGIHQWGDGTTVASADTNLYRGSQFHLSTDRYFGVATTTGLAQMTISTSTGIQLSLAASGGQPQWVFRNSTGNLMLATTTIDGLSTTTTSALEIAGGGFGTTTLRGLNIIGFATSTSNVGFNITTGCYAIGGTCLSTSGSSSVFPFTSVAGYNSTSTTLGLLNGIFSTASSTFSSSLYLSSLSQGFAFTGTNGLVSTVASSSIKLSWFNNDLAFITDPFTHPAAGQSATTSQINMVGFLSTASSTIVGNATTTGSHSFGSVYIPTLGVAAGSFLAINPNGLIIATSTPIGSSAGFTQAVQWATTAILAGTPTYANGSSGVGATLTEVGSGALSVDSNSPAAGDRVLVKNQASALQNGIYTVTATGSGIASYILTRATDYDGPTKIFPGISTYVISGTTNVDSFWSMTSAAPITVGTTALNYVEVSGGGANVTSVSNSDSTLTISPTAGAVIASLNLGHTNTWTVLQNFNYSSSTIYSSFITASSTNLFAGFLTLSTTTAGCANISATGQVFSKTCTSGAPSIGPVNVLQASDGAGAFIATGTPQLTVGNILATSTNAFNTFNGTTTAPAIQAGSTAIANNVFKVSILTGLDISASESVGGMFNASVGATDEIAAVFHSNHTGSSRTVSIVAENASYTGNALHVRSNGTATAFNLAGHPTGQGIEKINSDGVGDTNASGLSGDTSASGFLGQGIFWKGNNTNKILNLRNADSAEVMTLMPSGNLGLSTTSPQFQLTISTTTKSQIALEGGDTDYIWTIRSIGNNFYLGTSSPTTYATTSTPTMTILNGDTSGLVGLGSTTPWANVSITDSGNPYARPLFAISTSSDEVGHLFSVSATSTSLVFGASMTTLGARIDTGTRVGVGTFSFRGFGQLLDQLTVRGRINTEGWNQAFCDLGSGLGNNSTASNICASFNIGVAQTAVNSLQNVNAGTGGYAYARVGIPIGTAASAGSSVVFGETSGGAGWMVPATTTPVMEVNARINAPAATTSNYVIGFDSNTKTGTMTITFPASGCFFNASTTAKTGNWWAVNGNASAWTFVDTGVASSTNVTAVGGWRKFRIEADNDSCEYFIQSTESGNFSKVASITTNVPATVGLHANVWLSGNTAAGQGATIGLDYNHFRVWWRDFLPPL